MIPAPLTGHPFWLGWDITALLLACPLSDWSGARGRCRWCNTALTGRRTAWCSDECNTEARTNHYWTDASHRAKHLSPACSICSHPGEPPPEGRAWANFLLGIVPQPARPPRGSDVNGEEWTIWRFEQRQRFKVADQARKWEYRFTLETNHVRPVRGHHSAAGCHHHQVNLAVVCQPCHRTITARQRAAGELRPHSLIDHARSLWDRGMYEPYRFRR